MINLVNLTELIGLGGDLYVSGIQKPRKQCVF